MIPLLYLISKGIIHCLFKKSETDIARTEMPTIDHEVIEIPAEGLLDMITGKRYMTEEQLAASRVYRQGDQVHPVGVRNYEIFDTDHMVYRNGGLNAVIAGAIEDTPENRERVKRIMDKVNDVNIWGNQVNQDFHMGSLS